MIPRLQTEHLTLRGPEERDFEAYAAFRASPRSVTVGGPYDRDTARAQFDALLAHWARHGYGRWMVADRATDAPLGVVGLYFPEDWPEPEIAWSTFEAAEGRSIAYEAALAARAHAYDTLNWTTLMSAIDPANTRSVALATRLGAQPEGSFTHDTYGTLTIWRHMPPEALS